MLTNLVLTSKLVVWYCGGVIIQKIRIRSEFCEVRQYLGVWANSDDFRRFSTIFIKNPLCEKNSENRRKGNKPGHHTAHPNHPQTSHVTCGSTAPQYFLIPAPAFIFVAPLHFQWFRDDFRRFSGNPTFFSEENDLTPVQKPLVIFFLFQDDYHCLHLLPTALVTRLLRKYEFIVNFNSFSHTK